MNHADRFVRTLGLVLVLGLAAGGFCTIGCARDAQREDGGTRPWPAASEVSAAALDQELKIPAAGEKPVIVYVGPGGLFGLGHIPGAVAHGPGSSPDGLADLKAWAQGVAKNSSIVIYCGCCPLEDCPNLRPAFSALKDLGFARLRVLALPNNFNIDWVGQGFAVEK